MAKRIQRRVLVANKEILQVDRWVLQVDIRRDREVLRAGEEYYEWADEHCKREEITVSGYTNTANGEIRTTRQGKYYEWDEVVLVG